MGGLLFSQTFVGHPFSDRDVGATVLNALGGPGSFISDKRLRNRTIDIAHRGAGDPRFVTRGHSPVRAVGSLFVAEPIASAIWLSFVMGTSIWSDWIHDGFRPLVYFCYSLARMILPVATSLLFGRLLGLPAYHRCLASLFGGIPSCWMRCR